MTALFVRGLSKRAIREYERRGCGCHSKSIPRSVCAQLTQCTLWTLLAVLFLSSQITAFQIGCLLWHGETAHWEAREIPQNWLGNVQNLTVCPLQNAKKISPTSSTTHTSSDNQKVPNFLLAGISFKCQIIHLEQVTQTFRDLLWECQAELWIWQSFG